MIFIICAVSLTLFLTPLILRYGKEGKITILDLIVAAAFSLFWWLILIIKICATIESGLKNIQKFSNKNKVVKRFLNKQIF